MERKRDKNSYKSGRLIFDNSFVIGIHIFSTNVIFDLTNALNSKWWDIVIIIIIKKGRQCKAERELCTPYQSEDTTLTMPTYRQKEEKGKKSRRL